MKVLLLHWEDDLSCAPSQAWDLVVDLGRAPRSTYQRWRQWLGCEVLSLYDFAEEIEDLYELRNLVQLGSGQLVDGQGIDWWNALCLDLVPDLQQLVLVQRLCARLGGSCQLWASRPDRTASALARMMAVELRIAVRGPQAWRRRAAHYHHAFARLDWTQIAQVFEDKLRINGFAGFFPMSGNLPGKPVILLPTAYINSSRIAVEFANQLAEQEFLLVYTRTSGKLESVPSNVLMTPLPMESSSQDEREISELLDRWQNLKKRLTSQAKEFAAADAVGIFDVIPQLLRSGIEHRNAWLRVFDTARVVGCLCTDASNAATSICLDLAKARNLPAVACHHGALNFFMAIQTPPADFYVAKSELEHDYLRRVCQIPEEKIVDVIAQAEKLSRLAAKDETANRPSLVFFSEPYRTSYWRTDEIYAELLPPLLELARNLGLTLVLKIHPFESVKDHRSRLRRCLRGNAKEIQVIAGPPTAGLWQNTRIALTVQSTTALEAAALGIPVFLCAWLRDAHSGYLAQFARFGVGHVLQSVEQIAEVPALLKQQETNPNRAQIWKPMDEKGLGRLFSGNCSMQAAGSF